LADQGIATMTDEHGPRVVPPAKLLLAIFDASDEWHGEPLHEALVRVLEEHGVAGATVLQGIAGYGAHRGVHRKGLIGAPHDEPVALLVIENETKLRAALPILRSMVAEGVFVLLDAEVIPLL
jgi:PII-like signaling protein